MLRCHRALVGVLAAGMLTLPILGATAAQKKAPSKKAPAQSAKKADPKAGMTAFKAEGCAGCHKTKDFPDSSVGPDLSTIAQDHKPAQIEAYIKKPKSGSIMPAYKGPAGTLANMVAYLATQK